MFEHVAHVFCFFLREFVLYWSQCSGPGNGLSFLLEGAELPEHEGSHKAAEKLGS